MGLLDSAASLGADLITGWVNNQYAEDRQNAAQNFSAQQYATRYQTTVKDMQAAGLNPMLAYGQAPGNSPGGVVASSNATPSLGSSYNQSTIASAQEANLAANTRKTNAEAFVTEEYGIKQAEANYQSTMANIGLTAAQQEKVRSETDNNIAQLRNIKLEGDRLVRAAELLYQQSNLAFTQQLSEGAKQDMLRAQARMMMAQTGLYNLDLKAADALGNSGRIAQQVKPFFDILRSLMR